jgi:hypothetical protein
LKEDERGLQRHIYQPHRLMERDHSILASFRMEGREDNISICHVEKQVGLDLVGQPGNMKNGLSFIILSHFRGDY